VSNNTADAFSYTSFVGSGANTVTAQDTNAFVFQTQGANHFCGGSRTTLLTGLVAGSTTFKQQYRVNTGGSGSGTGTFIERKISAIPL